MPPLKTWEHPRDSKGRFVELNPEQAVTYLERKMEAEADRRNKLPQLKFAGRVG